MLIHAILLSCETESGDCEILDDAKDDAILRQVRRCLFTVHFQYSVDWISQSGSVA